jgi:hypothetical protein
LLVYVIRILFVNITSIKYHLNIYVCVVCSSIYFYRSTNAEIISPRWVDVTLITVNSLETQLLMIEKARILITNVIRNE